jgi:hypothetical protein
MRRYILNHHGSGPDSRSLAHGDQLSDGSAATNVCAGTYSHCAGKHSAAGNVNMVTDPAIMLNYGATVDYYITTELCACVHYASRQQLAARTDLCPSGTE